MYFGGGNKPTGQETTPGHHAHDPANPTNNNNTRFSDVPQDVLYRIASKLPPKEFARSSILSSQWSFSSSASCPRLTFDGICGCEECVSEVNAVLRQHQNKVVEALHLRIEFLHYDTTTLLQLARHIDAWVHFAVSSRTKSLALDLKPQLFSSPAYVHRYPFPFQLFHDRPGRHLQDMRLSFVSLSSLPPCFKGFPNLKRLHLQMLRAGDNSSSKDNHLEHLLSGLCRALEWLHIDRCNLDGDQLTVDTPLPRLAYLRVQLCRLSKIRFNAVNLATFEYEGNLIPIHLVSSFNLKRASIEFSGEVVVFHHALISLLNGLPSVQNLTLKICLPRLEKEWLWDNPLKFSNLRHLQLSMFIWSTYFDKILYAVSFLRATPFIEKLEVHFSASSRLWLSEVGPCRKDFGQCKYNYLKDIWMTGFKAARGQLEFLMHVVENAPALEVLLVEIDEYPHLDADTEPPIEEFKKIARTILSTVLQQHVVFDVI